LSRVQKKGKYGFVNQQGNEVIPLIYDYIDNFSEGLAEVRKNSKWGLVDKKGNEVNICEEVTSERIKKAIEEAENSDNDKTNFFPIKNSSKVYLLMQELLKHSILNEDVNNPETL